MPREETGNTGNSETLLQFVLILASDRIRETGGASPSARAFSRYRYKYNEAYQFLKTAMSRILRLHLPASPASPGAGKASHMLRAGWAKQDVCACETFPLPLPSRAP